MDYGENGSIYQIDEKEEIGGLGVLLCFCPNACPATTLYCLIPFSEGLMPFPNAEVRTGFLINCLGSRANFKPTASMGTTTNQLMNMKKEKSWKRRKRTLHTYEHSILRIST